MIIKTSQILKNLKGEELKDGEEPFTLGIALGNILASSQEGGKMKMFLLATKLAQNKSVEVDSADLGVIKKAVESTKIYSALVAGQVEMLLDEIKEVKK